MKRFLSALILLFFSSVIDGMAGRATLSNGKEFLSSEPIKPPTDIEYLRWKWFHDARSSSNAPVNARVAALAEIELGPRAQISAAPLVTDLLWVPIGPEPINSQME